MLSTKPHVVVCTHQNILNGDDRTGEGSRRRNLYNHRVHIRRKHVFKILQRSQSKGVRNSKKNKNKQSLIRLFTWKTESSHNVYGVPCLFWRGPNTFVLVQEPQYAISHWAGKHRLSVYLHVSILQKVKHKPQYTAIQRLITFIYKLGWLWWEILQTWNYQDQAPALI